MRAKWSMLVPALLAAAACGDPAPAPREAARPARVAPSVVVSEWQGPAVQTWRPPRVEVTEANAQALLEQAGDALEAGRLVDGDDGAIPLYLALRGSPEAGEQARAGLDRAIAALLARARAALPHIDEAPETLHEVQTAAAVLRVVALDRPDVERFLQRIDTVEEGQRYSQLGEQALARGKVGEDGKDGAIGWFRKALALRATDARALQGLAAAESALIRRAEQAAAEEDYAASRQWLDRAATVRKDGGAVPAARARIAFQRAARVGDLRDRGIAALAQPGGVEAAQHLLAQLLRIAPPGDPAATELRQRIDLAIHYGLFRPGQHFTDPMRGGGRGPEMVVIPYGTFRMGAPKGEPGSDDAERPLRQISFGRGLAVARNEITVGEFGRFVAATGYRTRSERRGYSIVYDVRNGNFVRRGRVDWRSDYRGLPAADDMPVIHVSAKDATAYAEWLAERTGERYRLPSEAEFEYALRAGSEAAYPWGNGAPPPGSGNFTGAGDRSPTGRRWQNAFRGYFDGQWGPAPVARYLPNRFGLHDMAGNVSEWVADCWHASYRRAPPDARAWVNPGCRRRVVRGGSWASSPAQTRSAWRSGLDADTTNARIGFRVVRDL